LSERRTIVAAALLSLALTLCDAGWGLPSRFHPDEKADVVAAMVRDHRLLPDSYINPSLQLHLLAPVLALQQGLAGGLGEPWSDPLLAARALSALATACAVLLLGLAAGRLAPGAGPLAAFLLALAPGVVNLGPFATPEPLLLALSALVLLLCLRHVEGRAPAWALGVVLGLAASTKYTAAALGVPVLAALWLRRREPARAPDFGAWLAAALALGGGGLLLAGPFGRSLAASLHLADLRLLHPESARAFVQGLARSALAAGCGLAAIAALAGWKRSAPWTAPLVRRELPVLALCALGAFVLGTPGALVEPRAFLSDLAFNAQTRHEYKGLVGEGTSFLPYLALARDALTLPVLAAAVLGLVVAGARIARGARGTALAALAALAPYLLVASSGHQALRFLAPAVPAAAALAALGLCSIPGPRMRRLLSAAVVARAAVAALLVVRLFFVDSRILAQRWLAVHVPLGASVDLITNYEGYAPRIPEGRTARVARTLSREMAPAERFSEAASAYPGEAADWLVLTGAFYQRFLDHPEQRPERTLFFRELLDGRAGFSRAARFQQEGWLRPPAEFLDPEIVILRKNSGPTAPSR
jgi:4-amino-4-deoxy-L-arabinose transferase-like glycosyltransferase